MIGSYFIDIQEFDINTHDLTLVEYFRYEVEWINNHIDLSYIRNGISWGTLALVVI